MNLQKRDNQIKMEIISCSCGWADISFDIRNDEHSFSVSTSLSSVENLLEALYHLHPSTVEDRAPADLVKHKIGIYEDDGSGYKLVKTVDQFRNDTETGIVKLVPWKATFYWDEEGTYVVWNLERKPDDNYSFKIKMTIDYYYDQWTSSDSVLATDGIIIRYKRNLWENPDRNPEGHYSYEVEFSDLCYAVADAYTKVLKQHGLSGFHLATYREEINIRKLLFIKAIGIGNQEAIELTSYKNPKEGDYSDLTKELELLLFDM